MDRYHFNDHTDGMFVEQGRREQDFIHQSFDTLLKPCNFDHPYFKGNLAFMRGEFPLFIEQMEAFGEAAGIENLNHTFYLHTYFTGRPMDGCSALGINLRQDGPVLLATTDICNPAQVTPVLRDQVLKIMPHNRPHAFAGIGSRARITVMRAINDAGLAIGVTSAHPKFTWPDNPEHLNFWFTVHMLSQYCADCDDVRHFLDQYRVSGNKGLNGTAIDAAGNMLGFELESRNIAFREPDGDMLLEVNHWQAPDLDAGARSFEPGHYRTGGYCNSRNRVMWLHECRDELQSIYTFDAFVDFIFENRMPGTLLQKQGLSIADWTTSHMLFMKSHAHSIRIHEFPIHRAQCEHIELPGDCHAGTTNPERSQHARL